MYLCIHICMRGVGGRHKVFSCKGEITCTLRDKSKEKILLKLCTDIFPLNELSRNGKINTKKQHKFQKHFSKLIKWAVPLHSIYFLSFRKKYINLENQCPTSNRIMKVLFKLITCLLQICNVSSDSQT